MTDSVIIVCPCCASSIDAYPTDDLQEFECVSCGQTWTMLVDYDRISTFSLA